MLARTPSPTKNHLDIVPTPIVCHDVVPKEEGGRRKEERGMKV
jgi:hypothetical protein